MRYKLLGKSGLRVSELALGTMTFGPDWGWGADKEESRRIFDAYVEAGGNFIDTANRYTEGTSERYVGEFVASDRDHFVVATKYTLFSKHGDPSASGNSRKNMVQSLEHSLKRLNMEHVDLFWVHAWDFTTPVEEVMRGLDDLVRSGKVLYVGISDTPAWVVAQANTLADLRGWTPFVAMQGRYSLADRSLERDLLPMSRALDLAVTPWSVLGAGVLTGKYNQKDPKEVEGRAATWGIQQRDLGIAEEIGKIAREIDHTPSQLAINWVRQQPGVVIPLIGAKRVDQVRDNLSCLEFTLTDEQMNRLSEVSKIELGFPHEFTGQMSDLIYGGTYDQIDNHHRR